MSVPVSPSVAAVRTWWPELAGVASAFVLWTAGILSDFAEGVVVAAVLYLAWGLLRRRPGDRPWLVWQVVGVMVFGAATVVAIRADEPASAYVLAAGWLGHAAWDVVHFRANRIVPRWWSLWCGVLDVLLAAVLVAAT